jgi:DNA replication protein DnaC
MKNRNVEELYDLKLKFMAKKLEEQYRNPASQDLCCDEILSLLITHEKQGRENNKQARRFREAGLKINACMEDISYCDSRGLDRHVMAQLASCEFINNSLNVSVSGLTGTGKTFVVCSLGDKAIRMGYTVKYIRLSRLFENLRITQADGSLPKYRARLAKYNLLMIDDWGLASVTSAARHELLELIDDRYEKGSLIIASQLPISQWHDYLGDPTIADAILDRVIQRSYRIELKGESMRKTDLPSFDAKEV